MRHKPKKIRKVSRGALVTALTVVSHLAVIVGALVAVLDTLHHW